MDDINLKIVAIERELTALQARIKVLGERLGAGENAVRAELNPAIQRERELTRELRDLRASTGREDPSKAQVMYGPPWQSFDRK